MDEECERWLLEHLPEHFDTFIKHEFTSLDAVCMITNEDLKDMEIESIGQRKQILAKVLLLKSTSRHVPSTSSQASGGRKGSKTYLQKRIDPSVEAFVVESGYVTLRQYIKYPQSEEDKFYNTVLEELYVSHFGRMDKAVFSALYYTERRRRWATIEAETKTDNYIRFERSKNPAAAQQLIEEVKLTSQSQALATAKLKTIKDKLTTLEALKANEMELYNQGFERASPQQQQWHQRALEILRQATDSLKALQADVNAAKEKLGQVFLCIGSRKQKYMESRSKKESRRKSLKRKEKRQEVGADKLLLKLLKEGTSEKEVYNVEDLKEKPHVRPKMDSQYFNILLQRGIFSGESQDFLKSLFRVKGGGKTASLPMQTAATSYIPIDNFSDLSSEGEIADDIFDFIEIQYNDESMDEGSD